MKNKQTREMHEMITSVTHLTKDIQSKSHVIEHCAQNTKDLIEDLVNKNNFELLKES